MRRACAALLLAAGVAGAADEVPRWAGRPGCRFEVPPDWPAARLQWSGACADRRAQGRGVLRADQGAGVVRIYFGRLQAGHLALGATRLEGGYAAGRFQAGRPAPDNERNDLIQAFAEAGAAARELAAHYRRLGQDASARFYEDEARRLAAQLD